MKHFTPFFFLLFFCFSLGYGQAIPPQQIDTITISAARIESTQNKLPKAVSKIQFTPIDDIKPQQSIQESLQSVAGVFVQNATNFAQDARISIRGFGSRAAFGLRGIKLIVDGFPETTPDGQGQLDNLNLGIIDQIEILKGSSSSLYGNASGGVVDIQTLSFDSFDIDSISQSAMKAKIAIGAFGFQNYQATAALGDSIASYIFHGNYITSDGYRANSDYQQINTNFKGEFKLNDNAKLTAIVNYADAPEANDAGGLTLDEVNEDRRQARSRNTDFKSGESVSQFKAGTHLEWNNSKSTTVNGYAFYSNRKFLGLLPFESGGIVDLNRNYLGQGTNLTYRKSNNTLQAGYDFGYQNDDRKRFNNLQGERGEQSLGQKEQFTNIGFYLLDHLTYRNWFFNAGLRYDYNLLRADDYFLENGDDSGSINLASWNPSVGVSYAFAKAITLYTNFSTSFETPVLSELSARPDGSDGFNDNLKPQTATTIELGAKGVMNALRYDITLFSSSTEDDLVPFEVEQFPERTFYRNAGSTIRNGLEVALEYPLTKSFSSSLTYTLSDFQYDNFVTDGTNFKGKFLPGIPKHKTTFGVNYTDKSGFNASLNSYLVGEQYADDANETRVDGYEFISFDASYQMHLRTAQIKPYVSVQNVLNQEYTDNVRINAFGGRYYEPAPTIAVYAGVILMF
ncbi:TonB-dependent receptor family protein [Dokdonia sp. Hel_I_53]|uniref:TonB-dependent receptor family protein n=1 Tax=Dokdonia sp. Hel_I_53 TaxID=1566287 RepID=UPI001199502B|nr:TonB-dependent receptor [Dokdonia sp. Hel_I_53]TVZ52326.1 iron complex outermembrane receptor protein [Dokdonia sp. Hel_I_53]